MRREQVAPTDRLGVPAVADFPPDARSAARARTFVSQFGAAAGLSGEVRRTAALLVSELVTNAIVHGRSGACVEVSLDADQVLRISVSDDNPLLLPTVDVRPRATAEGGRGLLIVSLLAARWGVAPVAGGGKTVWFELDA